MSFVEKMRERYTTKVYQPDFQLDDSTVENLKEVLRLSPSSINSQPWLFTFVSDPEVKERLARHSLHNAEKVRFCSHVVAFGVYADITTFEAERISQLPEYAAAYYHNNIAPKGTNYIEAWLGRQLYISLGVLLSACADMGIDATPMEGIDTVAYTDILGLRKYKVMVAVALGKRAADDANQPSVKPKQRREDVFSE